MTEQSVSSFKRSCNLEVGLFAFEKKLYLSGLTMLDTAKLLNLTLESAVH